VACKRPAWMPSCPNVWLGNCGPMPLVRGHGDMWWPKMCTKATDARYPAWVSPQARLYAIVCTLPLPLTQAKRGPIARDMPVDRCGRQAQSDGNRRFVISVCHRRASEPRSDGLGAGFGGGQGFHQIPDVTLKPAQCNRFGCDGKGSIHCDPCDAEHFRICVCWRKADAPWIWAQGDGRRETAGVIEHALKRPLLPQ